MRRGLIAEYDGKDALLVAIHVVRSRGYTRLEAYTPCPVPELDEALGAPRSPLSVAAGLGGALGAGMAYLLQWILVAYLYPVDVGSRPPHMPLAFVVIMVEMGFVTGALFVFFAMLLAARMFRLWDPECDVPGFESVTRAGFWLAVGADDPRWNRAEIERVVAGTGPRATHGFGGLG